MAYSIFSMASLINKVFVIFVPLLVLTASLTACSEEVEFELKDSGMSASDGSINWLDNERVIFVHFEGKKGKIYIWNTITGEIKKHSDEVDSGICYSEGYIYYRSRVEGDSIYYKKGMFPNEKEYLVKDDMKSKAYDKYSCLWRDKLPEQKNEFIHYLKEEHGYLHIGPLRAKEFEYTVYVRADGKKIKMPFSNAKVRLPKGYYPFKGAYFLWPVIGANERWKKVCYAWWLYPNGKTDNLCVSLPDGVINGSVLLYPVLEGYLFISHGTGGEVGAGNSGVYYYDKDMNLVDKLLSGSANGIAISPNGCKVAFYHNPLINKNVTLKMINLCKI